MSKLHFAFTCILLSYSLAEAKEESNVDMKTKEMPVGEKKDMDMNMKEKEGEDEDSSNVDLMAVMSECNETFTVEMHYLETLNESGSFPDELVRNPKCFIRCVMEKTGVASEQGMYDPQMTAMLFGWEKFKAMGLVEGMATDCTLNRGETCKCERAYNYLKCFMEKQIMEFEKSMG